SHLLTVARMNNSFFQNRPLHEVINVIVVEWSFAIDRSVTNDREVQAVFRSVFFNNLLRTQLTYAVKRTLLRHSIGAAGIQVSTYFCLSGRFEYIEISDDIQCN